EDQDKERRRERSLSSDNLCREEAQDKEILRSEELPSEAKQEAAVLGVVNNDSNEALVKPCLELTQSSGEVVPRVASAGGWGDFDFDDVGEDDQAPVQHSEEAPAFQPAVAEEDSRAPNELVSDPSADQASSLRSEEIAPQLSALGEGSAEAESEPSPWVVLSPNHQGASEATPATDAAGAVAADETETEEPHQAVNGPAGDDPFGASNEFDELLALDAALAAPPATADAPDVDREGGPALDLQAEPAEDEAEPAEDQADVNAMNNSDHTRRHSDGADGEISRLQQESEDLRQRLRASEDFAASQQDELGSLRSRVPQLEAQLLELQRSMASREEELAARLEAEAAQRQHAEAELAEARSQADQRTAELLQQIESLASAPQFPPREEVTAPQVEGSEEFNLPDFVWSCGNSEVMAFVQKIMEENAALRKNGPSADDEAARRYQPTGEPFDASEASADAAIAFAATVGENDGHQIAPLLLLLKQYAGLVEVCSQVCAALENLTFTDVENRRSIVKQGGVESILDMLRSNEDADAVLLRPAVDALWNITFDDEAVERATDAAAIELLASVMSKQTGSAELQGGACAVLLNLAVKDQNRWKIVQSGGVSLVAAAMQRHSTCEEVLEQGCQALYMLAYHQDLRPSVLAGKGGDAAALAASYPVTSGSGRTQKWGRWLQEVLAC
ncbi:unnamed protein product, partial [Polarella glacialis]